ncbi:MAG: hypothetical protein JWN41_1574 [Thermoleophilia bacterium]|nr:hypothetical protein [Thermoleophilia bacterium]
MTSISSSTGPDLLAPMRSSLNTISAVGTPTTQGDAATVLGQGTNYLQGAHETVAKLDVSIERRTKALAELSVSDPAGAQRERDQLDLLNRLRERIEQSIERVGAILTGRDPESVANKSHAQQQLEELDQLEARRRLLAGQNTFAAAPAPVAQVAGTYAAQLPL